MKKLFKKFSVIALLLAAVVVTVGCGDKKTKYTVTYYDVDDVNTVVGTETVVEGNKPTGLISNFVLESEMFKDAAMTEAWGNDVVTANVSIYGEFTSKDGYTYQSSFNLSPKTFNPFQYESATDSVPLDYTTLGLYGYSYNADKTGFELKPVMAAADPVDVTTEYAKDDSYGIEGETSGYAFRIALNRHATWENGEVINADDYIYSLKALLDPKFQNHRASDYYAGSTAIFGAKDFFYSGQTTYLSAVEVVGGTQEGYEGLYFDASNVTAFANLMGGTDLTKLANYKGYFSDGETNYYEQLCQYAGDKRVPMNEELFTIWKNIMTKGPLSAYWVWADNEMPYFSVAKTTFPEYPWEKVGLKKIDEWTVDIIYTTQLAGFYKKYSIGLPLVNETLYENCKQYNEETKVWSSTYGSSVETYLGYGPYKMTKYIVDQLMVFERNENWFGYSEAFADEYGKFVAEFDGQVHEQYQTDRITLRFVQEISTREQMFLAGKLDGFGMTREYYEKYRSSIRLYSATGASTFYGILLSDYTSLVEREAVLNGVTYDSATYDSVKKQYNKTILTIKEFRQALCYAIDRKTLVTNLYPGGSSATSLYSDLILADPDAGKAFNKYTATKEAICEFWGVEYGEGKEFKTLDEAYAAISGFDLASAKKLVDVAVDKAIEQGLMTSSTIVKIDYCAASDSENEQLWYNTFNNCLTELFKGTKLDGKFEYVYNPNLGDDYGDDIQNGLADTAWGFGWQGSALDPYSLFQVYVDAGSGESDVYQYDKWINRNTKNYEVTLNIDLGDGVKEHTYTAYTWWEIVNGIYTAPEGQTSYDASYAKQIAGVISGDTRATILAACELAVLRDYTHIPMMNEGSVSLLSYKVNYGSETYMFGMGFGGLRYITYNYTDGQWADYVASQPGGNLSY
ncbi:MAG: hypothetical protein IJE45_05265 [Bacilli bacterium]|nr:hypothetical protein [Bacilli bacterium]